MSRTGLSRIRGLNEDDLVLNFDADEIPKAEVVNICPATWSFLISQTFIVYCYFVPLFPGIDDW